MSSRGGFSCSDTVIDEGIDRGARQDDADGQVTDTCNMIGLRRIVGRDEEEKDKHANGVAEGEPWILGKGWIVVLDGDDGNDTAGARNNPGNLGGSVGCAKVHVSTWATHQADGKRCQSKGVAEDVADAEAASRTTIRLVAHG